MRLVIAQSPVSGRLLTPEDAADRLAIGRSLLYRLLRTGELRSVRVAGCRRVAEADLVAYVEALRTRSEDLPAEREDTSDRAS